jgi:hypothetical protein
MYDDEAGIAGYKLARSLKLCRKNGDKSRRLRCCAGEHPADEDCGVVQLRKILLAKNMRNDLNLLC